jgi:hypothetical protein
MGSDGLMVTSVFLLRLDILEFDEKLNCTDLYPLVLL